jgi:hypothetical protein
MEEYAFDTIWQTISTSLKPGMFIRNWTQLKGYLGDEMKVVEVSRGKVVIEAPNAKNLISVPREDFQRVWQVWLAYKGGRMQRQEIREMTFFSKYIISILHWIESK